jgi:hypothetical protein
MLQRPNFNQLWEQAVSITNSYQNNKVKSILLNFSDKKESICRKLGIIGNQDVIRLDNHLAKIAKSQSNLRK